MVKLIKFIDKYIGIPLSLLFGIVNKLWFIKKFVKPKRILVIQLWGIGETILALPAIKALKQKYEVDVLCTNRNKDVFYGQGVNLKEIKLNIFSIDFFCLLNFHKYDLVIDMEEYLNISALIAFFVGRYRIGYSHHVRSLLYSKTTEYNDKQHIALTFLDLVKVLGVKYDLKKLIPLKYSKQDKIKVDSLIKRLKLKKIVGITPGAAESSKSRMWPKERFAKLADKLDYDVVFVGAGYEKKLIDDVQSLMTKKSNNLAGKLSLRQSFYLISKCKLFISNDTGPMHVAAAIGVKTIGLFGPNTPVRFGAFGNVSLYHKLKCSPCINVHKGQVPECKFDDNKCMQKITVEEVLKAVKKIEES